jgi:hypothetical protein
MHVDYIRLVLKIYQQKVAENDISPRLINPTPAKLRAECMAVFAERHDAKDEQTLRTFFGKQDSLDAYAKAIKKLHTDKFKPLANYLKRLVATTDDKNTELLAWLIDFEPRPFKFGSQYGEVLEPERLEKEKQPMEVEVQVEVVQQIDKNEGNIAVTVAPQRFANQPKRSLEIRVVIVFVFLIIFMGAGIYWVGNLKENGKESCMYWAGDHYQQVSCNQKFRDTLVIALDSTMLHHFKKISQPDTITGNAKGYVWYIKLDNRIEFYTADGYHPIYQQRKLKPVTDHIINIYIRHN